MTELPVWEINADGDFETDYQGAFLYVAKEWGGWTWSSCTFEQVISGPYPGTPDTKEHEHGEGLAPTATEGMWRAMRATDRAMIAEDVAAAEENAWLDQMEADQAAYERSLDELGVGEGLIDGPGA